MYGWDKIYTAEEIHEANEVRMYCIICDVYIDADCECFSCEDRARKNGGLRIGEEEDPEETP